MKTKEILLQVIEYLDLFESSVPEAQSMSIEAFIAFVSSLLHSQHTAEYTHRQGMVEVGIARYLSLLHRYSRAYIKEALSISDCLQTEEEYTYLVTLLSEDGLTKTELHTRNLLEKTTGSEVLRRLRAHQLIKEKPDERDRRSIRVYITPKGRAELAKVLPHLRSAALMLSDGLEPEQKNLLHFLLTMLIEHQLDLSNNRS